MKSVRKWLGKNWWFLLLLSISSAIVISVCFMNLGGMTDGYLSNVEVQALQASQSGTKLLNNPLFIQHKLLEYGTIKLGLSSVYVFRTVTALFGVLLIFVFYNLSKIWFSPRIAWFSSIMLATSSLFLSFSRLAVPDILTPLMLASLFWVVWRQPKVKSKSVGLLVLTLILVNALYLPGMIWFLAVGVFIKHKYIKDILSKTSFKTTAVYVIIFIVLVLPLGYAIFRDSQILLEWLALPNKFSFIEFCRQLIAVPASLVVRAQQNPVFNLGRLPYIDILTLCLSALGVYAYALRIKLVRTRVIVVASLVSWLLIALDNQINVSILLPIIYLTVAGGIMFMLQQWYTVFPKNPIARYSGMVLLLLVLLISINYNISRYFLAWVNNPITKTQFQSTIPSDLVQ